MRFSLEVGHLQKTVEDLVAIATSKNIQSPIDTHIKIDAQTNSVLFYAQNAQVQMLRGLDLDVERPGICTIPAQRTLELLKNFENHKKITISMSDKQVVKISHSRSRFTLSCMNHHQFLPLETHNYEYIPINSQSFLEAIDKVSPSMAEAKNVFNSSLHAILFEPTSTEGFVRAVATDSHKLTTCKVPGLLPRAVLIPGSSLSVIKKALVKSEEFGLAVADDDSTVSFKFDDGVLVARLLVNKFPAYQSIIPVGSCVKVYFSHEEFVVALKRILIFIDKTLPSITCDFDVNAQALTISATSNEGTAEETVHLLSGTDIVNDFRMTFNGLFLKQIMSKITAEIILLRVYGPKLPAVFLGQDSNTMSIIMPLILK